MRRRVELVDTVQTTVNPADADTLAGAIRQVLDKFLQNNIDDMLPARVISYDASTNIVRVQPLIRLVDTQGNEIKRSQLTIPVFNIGGGNALLRFNLNTDDLGWIKANDRDISLFLNGLSESRPNTNRKHQFDDAVFFPDKMRQFTASSDDSGALAVLQNTTGTTRISIFESSVVVTANEITINGPLTVNGTISASGNISSSGDVLAGSVSLTNHNHGYIDNIGLPSVATPSFTQPADTPAPPP